ncbi:hypothetical protein WMF37_30115 [Sorangium sp. So ce291]|uniref:hypothetical protein n=1 Tax=Sorangium sp. So ce291 TaxID=3133294 RepID=UPI003F601E5F
MTKPFSPIEHRLAMLPRAAARLIEAGRGQVDPTRTCDRSTLAAKLEKCDLPVLEAFLTFEAIFGGIRFGDGDGGSYSLGICERLPTRPPASTRRAHGELLVRAGRHEDDDLYLDTYGRLYAQDHLRAEVRLLGGSAAEHFSWIERDREHRRAAARTIEAPLSERARRSLTPAAHGAMAFLPGDRAPLLTCSREELAEVLREQDVPEYEILFTIEEQLGGVAATWLHLGPYHMLHEPWLRACSLRQREDAAPLVLIGRDAEGLLYVDAAGTVFAAPYRLPGETRVGASLITLLERWALLREFTSESALQIELAPRCGAPLAAALGISLIAEASDVVAAFWKGADVVITDGRPLDRAPDGDADATTVLVLSAERAADVLRAAGGAARRARVTGAMWLEARDDIQPAPDQDADALAPRVKWLMDEATPAVRVERSDPEVALADPEAQAGALAYDPMWPGESGFVFATATGVEQRIQRGGMLLQRDRFEGNEVVREVVSPDPLGLAPALTGATARAISRSGGYRDLRVTCPPERLATLLAERGARSTPHLIELERHLGGLIVRGSGEALLWLGVGAYLAWYPLWLPSADAPDLVPIGEHGSRTLLIDSAGAVFARTTPASPEIWRPSHEPHLVAPSLAAYMDSAVRVPP